MKPLISVIVPVYNVELYLKRCIDSLLRQTYENIEIILVDDGSPDKCGQICDEYALNNNKITVIHKQNGGLSSARNAGIVASKGRYIGFVDSDDWVTDDIYQYFYNCIESYNADAAQVEFTMVAIYSEKIKKKKEQIKTLFGKNVLQFYMMEVTTTGEYSVCRCLFSRMLVEGISFREGKISEDLDFKYKVLSRCSKFVVSNQIKYFYFQSGSSLSTGGLKINDFDLYDAANELCILTQNESFGAIKKLGEAKSARTAFSLLCKIAYYGIADSTIEKTEAVRVLSKEHRKNVWKLISAPIPVSRKLISIMLAVSFPFTEFAVHLIRKKG